jgi:hypothetical protein
MKSSVSQEMIDEYKKEIMKPVEIGGKKFLYSPVDMPKLPEAFVPKPFTHKRRRLSNGKDGYIDFH